MLTDELCGKNVSVNQKLCLCFVDQYCFIAISGVSFLRIMGATLYVQFSTSCSYTRKVKKKSRYHASFVCVRF